LGNGVVIDRDNSRRVEDGLNGRRIVDAIKPFFLVPIEQAEVTKSHVVVAISAVAAQKLTDRQLRTRRKAKSAIGNEQVRAEGTAKICAQDPICSSANTGHVDHVG